MFQISSSVINEAGQTVVIQVAHDEDGSHITINPVNGKIPLSLDLTRSEYAVLFDLMSMSDDARARFA